MRYRGRLQGGQGASNGPVVLSVLGFSRACPAAIIALCPWCQCSPLLWAPLDCASLLWLHAELWPSGLYKVMRTSLSVVTPSLRCFC